MAAITCLYMGRGDMESNLDIARTASRLILGSVMLVSAASPVAGAGQSVAAKTPKAGAQLSSPQRPTGTAQQTPVRALAAAEAQPPGTAAKAGASLSNAAAQLGPGVDLQLGKATLLRLPQPVERISVGNPSIADVTMISTKEVYVLGKDLGTTNIIIWDTTGQATILDVKVNADPSLLEKELRDMLPGEIDIKVKTSADSLILVGSVSDAVKADYAVQIAQAWIRRLTRGLVAPITLGDGKGGTTVAISETQNTAATVASAGPRVVNMLAVRAPQQVMLEVKVAEVSKTLLDKLGVSIGKQNSFGGATYSLLSTSEFFNQLLGTARVATSIANFAQVDGQRDDGLIKLLAEPNLMAISGQEASFNAGGKIFIPVARANDAGGTTITLEEKEFGVGVKFKPTVLEGGRINLQVASRVSEPVQSGSPFTSINGTTAILPSFTERRAETTVQLHDGQSFMIAGLIKGNSSETVKRFPGLGDLPILGVLFRSSQFQREKSELMFVITPRLVQPLPANYTVPTDNFVEPSRKEYFLEGKTEGTKSDGHAADARKAGAADKQPGGFEMK
jgi:pilus assembly protein CpaC